MQTQNAVKLKSMFIFYSKSLTSPEDFKRFLFLQLQSNLIPGLNLNALGIFPGAAGGGMSSPVVSGPPAGAQAGYQSFGVRKLNKIGVHVC